MNKTQTENKGRLPKAAISNPRSFHFNVASEEGSKKIEGHNASNSDFYRSEFVKTTNPLIAQNIIIQKALYRSERVQRGRIHDFAHIENTAARVGDRTQIEVESVAIYRVFWQVREGSIEEGEGKGPAMSISFLSFEYDAYESWVCGYKDKVGSENKWLDEVRLHGIITAY